MAAAIDPDPHAPAATSGINNDSGKRVILNELLSFVAYKLNIMPPDTIIQLCASFYSDDEVDTAKILLFDLCADQADRQDRLIKRSGQKKKAAESEGHCVTLREKTRCHKRKAVLCGS